MNMSMDIHIHAVFHGKPGNCDSQNGPCRGQSAFTLLHFTYM